MSEPIRRQPASISGPLKRQQFLNGELPESRRRCVVEGITAHSEAIGFVTAAAMALPASKELLLRVPDPTALWAGDAKQEDGSTISCELRIETEVYGVTAIDQVEIEGSPAFRVAPTVLTVNGRRVSVMIPEAFSGRLLLAVDAGQQIELFWRHVVTQYYGTFICVPRQSLAFAEKLARLESDWRRDNREPLFKDGGQRNPIPPFVEQRLQLEAEVGTSVVGFEDFTDDNGPIPPVLPDGRLNEPGLLSLLQIREFHDALNEFYAGDAFDLEQWLALEKKLSTSSSLTSNGQAQSAGSPPS